MSPAPARLALAAQSEDARHEVSVDGIAVMADIGVLAHEIGVRQPLIIDVRLHLCMVSSDRIEATIDYNAVVAHAESLALTRIGLIETFAHRLARACLDHPVVVAADVRISKPQALGNGRASARVVLRD